LQKKRRGNYLFEELNVSRGIKDRGEVIKRKIKKCGGKGRKRDCKYKTLHRIKLLISSYNNIL
jgi:hypothetical protein